MHITQTYLGQYGHGGLFVYYLFEDYDDTQNKLTKEVQDALDDLGADFMNDVDLFRPNERFAGNIAREVRKIEPIWRVCCDKLPGFLVSYKPLVEIDVERDSIIFYSIKDRNKSDAIEVVRKIRSLTLETIKNAAFQVGAPASRANFGQRLVDALQVKPTFFGIGVDLKQLVFRK